MSVPADIQILHDQLDDAERDARQLAAGPSDELGNWRPTPGSWTVAECLDHLAITNRYYLAAMSAPALRARRIARSRHQSRHRHRRVARPGRRSRCPAKHRSRLPPRPVPTLLGSPRRAANPLRRIHPCPPCLRNRHRPRTRRSSPPLPRDPPFRPSSLITARAIQSPTSAPHGG